MTTPVREPQRRLLVRARDLTAFRGALVERALAADPARVHELAVIVPTRASAELLRQSIEAEAHARGRRAVLLPHLLTRDEWLAHLHQAIPGAPPLLTPIAREIVLARAARRVADRHRMPGTPFPVRPGLVARMLRFYDELRRRRRTVRRFARALFDELRHERGTDRGSESLIHQTAFLGLAFLAYEREIAAQGVWDEHQLRRRLLTDEPPLPFRSIVVAVADRTADERGLWPADFDLIGRLRGLASIEIVMTDETHDAGVRERLEEELPGIEETSAGPGADRAAVLVRPAAELAFVSRDREEELRDVARVIRARASDAGHALIDPVGVVFHRPLPYLYLAQQVMADARIPVQAFDALPLAAEPHAALLDLVLTVARTGGTREAVVALLRSTLVSCEAGGVRVGLRDAAALDFALTERRATGEADTYPDEAARWASRAGRSSVDPARVHRAAAAAAALHDELLGFRKAERASLQVRTISNWLRRHHRAAQAEDPVRQRSARARAALLGVLDGLVDALERYDDAQRPHDELVAMIHHAIEGHTFTPRLGTTGVHLVDSVAARFGRFAYTHLVGLIESDWLERTPHNILYTPSLLKPLGWPQAADRTDAEMAAFRDLLRLAESTVHLHAFQLEGDSVVALSPLVEAARAMAAVTPEPPPARRIFADELLAAGPPVAAGLDVEQDAWLAARLARPALDTPAYSGLVDPQPAQRYRVSRVDRYAECPFKYFAESVLGLPEEREELAGLTPLERGDLIHRLFEEFYKAWHASKRGTITPGTLPDALSLFARLTQAALAALPEADRALEETRLLGSIVARGIAERVFELEIDEGGTITDRQLEYALDGEFTFPLLGGMAQKAIALRGRADRVDVFDDGSIRVVDYKLSRLPDDKTSLQIAVYAHCVQQALSAADERPHEVRSAVYLAFGDERRFVGGFPKRTQSNGPALQARAAEFAGTVQRIEEGRFPARPLRTDQCRWCRVAGVCRKEYRVEADAAEPV